MKIKLEKYKWQHFPAFFFGLMDFNSLKSAGILKKSFLIAFFSSFSNETKKGIFKFSIFADEEIAGGLDITKISKSTFKIGIIIFKKYKERNVATLSVKKAFDVAKKMGAKKILATNYKDNLSSIGLVKKLGYKKIGVTNDEFCWEKKLK